MQIKFPRNSALLAWFQALQAKHIHQSDLAAETWPQEQALEPEQEQRIAPPHLLKLINTQAWQGYGIERWTGSPKRMIAAALRQGEKRAFVLFSPLAQGADIRFQSHTLLHPVHTRDGQEAKLEQFEWDMAEETLHIGYDMHHQGVLTCHESWSFTYDGESFTDYRASRIYPKDEGELVPETLYSFDAQGLRFIRYWADAQGNPARQEEWGEPIIGAAPPPASALDVQLFPQTPEDARAFYTQHPQWVA